MNRALSRGFAIPNWMTNTVVMGDEQGRESEAMRRLLTHLAGCFPDFPDREELEEGSFLRALYPIGANPTCDDMMEKWGVKSPDNACHLGWLGGRLIAQFLTPSETPAKASKPSPSFIPGSDSPSCRTTRRTTPGVQRPLRGGTVVISRGACSEARVDHTTSRSRRDMHPRACSSRNRNHRPRKERRRGWPGNPYSRMVSPPGWERSVRISYSRATT